MLRFALFLPVLFAVACAPLGPPRFPDDARHQTARKPAAKPVKPRRPAWRPRKVVADGREVAGQNVTVRAGDSLSLIAGRSGASVAAIAAANRIARPYIIQPGQVLRIPAGRYHRVKYGETGIAIARAYGADWDRIVTVNRLRAPFVLRVGQKLRMPTRAAVKRMTLAERAAAFSIDIDDLISGSEPAEPDTSATGEAPNRAGYARPLPPPPSFDGNFARPVHGRLISRFGAKAGGLYNDGINIRANAGSPIRAAAHGVVVYAGGDIEGFGNLVLLKHGGGWVTAYAHAQDMLVIRGDSVRQGDPIARVGSTGSVTSPQLHFEVRKGRKAVDPLKYLPPFS